MYCPSCGKPADASVKFCPNCGAQVSGAAVGSGYVPGPSVNGANYSTGKLVRPRYPRMIGSVCAAFALQYGWDINLVRVVTAVLALFTSGLVGLAYLVAWVVIPEAPYTLPSNAAGYTPAPPPPSYNNPGNPTV